MDDNGEFLDKVTELVDEWISCSLETGNPYLNDLVKEVNVHHHSKSCQKGGNGCRFSFPRLPSNETLVAYPSSAEDSENVENIVIEIFQFCVVLDNCG